MAQLFCTGPAHIYVAVLQIPTAPISVAAPAASNVLYLGTAEQAPSIEIMPTFMPHYNDIGGQVPFDYSFQGEEAIIRVDLTRWNEAVYTKCQGRPSAYASVRGAGTSTDVGTLMLQEGYAYDLWIHFPYQAKTAMSAMPTCYHFPAAWMIGPDSILPGTKANKRTCIFKAARFYVAADGTWGLYDNTIVLASAGTIPAVPPNNATGVIP